MPVTLTINQHDTNEWRTRKASSAEQLFDWSCGEEYSKSKSIIQSSFPDGLFDASHVSSSGNGFVRAVFHAYSRHHHLTLRPEDVWFSILCQLNFYINAHAEELRSYFVAHEGQKELEVVEWGTIHTVDFGAIARKMTRLIEKNILDPELRTWVMPSFSTTTDSDRVVASILMMGALQKYFSYRAMLCCGIPSVTLLGERADWETMLTKLDKLTQLGKEPTQFAELLKPVLRRFVASFDDPTSDAVVEFWNRCAHKTGGSGPSILSGWVTAFCFWDEDGKCLYGDGPEPLVTSRAFRSRNARCELDGTFYHQIDIQDIPAGFASVPLAVNDNGTMYETAMVAGSIGITATTCDQMRNDSQNRLEEPVDAGTGATSEEPVLNSIQPLSGWWMYETKEKKESQPAETNNVGKAVDQAIALTEERGSRSQLKRPTGAKPWTKLFC